MVCSFLRDISISSCRRAPFVTLADANVRLGCVDPAYALPGAEALLNADANAALKRRSSTFPDEAALFTRTGSLQILSDRRAAGLRLFRQLPRSGRATRVRDRLRLQLRPWQCRRVWSGRFPSPPPIP